MTDDNLEEFTEKGRALNTINIRYVYHRGTYILEYVGESDDDTEIVERETVSHALRDLADRLDN